MVTESIPQCARMKADCVFGTAKGDTRVRGELDLVMAVQNQRG